LHDSRGAAMTTKKLLEIVKDRGLEIVIRDGRPVLHKPKDIGKEAVTDELLSVLKIHRERIIQHLSTSPQE
jgi:hypothetical protein